MANDRVHLVCRHCGGTFTLIRSFGEHPPEADWRFGPLDERLNAWLAVHDDCTIEGEHGQCGELSHIYGVAESMRGKDESEWDKHEAYDNTLTGDERAEMLAQRYPTTDETILPEAGSDPPGASKSAAGTPAAPEAAKEVADRLDAIEARLAALEVKRIPVRDMTFR